MKVSERLAAAACYALMLALLAMMFIPPPVWS